MAADVIKVFSMSNALVTKLKCALRLTSPFGLLRHYSVRTRDENRRTDDSLCMVRTGRRSELLTLIKCARIQSHCFLPTKKDKDLPHGKPLSARFAAPLPLSNHRPFDIICEVEIFKRAASEQPRRYDSRDFFCAVTDICWLRQAMPVDSSFFF